MKKQPTIQLEYWNGKEWIKAGDPWHNEGIAWMSLGGDNKNYRSVNIMNGDILTDKRPKE